MLDWLKRRGVSERRRTDKPSAGAAPAGRAMSGEYVFLYQYLEKRYADTVVLTFAQIEDLLGFTLPDVARSQGEWWTRPAPSDHADSWILAHRTAVPNLNAGIVVFERAA
jgi:hypothetical protein